jgi:hypothetical protein
MPNGSSSSASNWCSSSLIVVLLVQNLKLGDRLDDVQTVVHGQQQAEQQRDRDSKGNAVALALVVEGIAAGFATPPYPDVDRQRAVQGLCATARAFRQSVGAPPAAEPPCG